VLTITSVPEKATLEGASALCGNVTAASGVGDAGVAEINLSEPGLLLGECHRNEHTCTHCSLPAYVSLSKLLRVALALGATERFGVSRESCIGNQSGMIPSRTQ